MQSLERSRRYDDNPSYSSYFAKSFLVDIGFCENMPIYEQLILVLLNILVLFGFDKVTFRVKLHQTEQEHEQLHLVGTRTRLGRHTNTPRIS